VIIYFFRLTMIIDLVFWTLFGLILGHAAGQEQGAVKCPMCWQEGFIDCVREINWFSENCEKYGKDNNINTTRWWCWKRNGEAKGCVTEEFCKTNNMKGCTSDRQPEGQTKPETQTKQEDISTKNWLVVSICGNILLLVVALMFGCLLCHNAYRLKRYGAINQA
jgi:hypothetical protein